MATVAVDIIGNVQQFLQQLEQADRQIQRIVDRAQKGIKINIDAAALKKSFDLNEFATFGDAAGKRFIENFNRTIKAAGIGTAGGPTTTAPPPAPRRELPAPQQTPPLGDLPPGNVPNNAPPGNVPSQAPRLSEFAQLKKSLEDQLRLQRENLALLELTGKTGTAEYQKVKASLNQAETALSKVGSAAQKAGLGFKFNPDQFNALGLISGVTQLGNALQGLQAPFVELDKQIKNIGTLGIPTDSLDKFQSQILALSTTVPDTAANIANGVYNAISAGVTGTEAEVVKFVEIASKAGVAGISDTNTAVNVLTSVVNAYKLGAKGAQQVSDELFAAVKEGKTSFPEMAAALSKVVPVASATGIKFDEVSAAIAQMTALGVPTNQAATQIKAAIVSLEKPSKGVREVYDALGLTVEDVQNKLKGQGLIATLQELDVGMKAIGKNASQVFGRFEAASAALLLAGDNAQGARDKLAAVRRDVEQGVSTQAYNVAAQGIEVRTKVLLNTIQAGFSSIFASIGAGANIAIGTLNSFGPTLLTLSQLPNIIPPGIFDGISSKVDSVVSSIQSLIPAYAAQAAAATAAAAEEAAITTARTAAQEALVASLAAGATQQEAAAAAAAAYSASLAEQAAVAEAAALAMAQEAAAAAAAAAADEAFAIAIAQGATAQEAAAISAATYTATLEAETIAATESAAATEAAWTAALGPIGVAILVVAALAATFYLLYTNVQPFADAVDSAVGFVIEVFNLLLPVLKQIGSVFLTVGELIGTLFLTPFKILFSVIGALFSLVGSLFSIFGGAGQSASALDLIAVVFEKIRIAVIVVQAAIQGTIGFINAIVDGITNVISKVGDLDFGGAVDALFSIGSDAAEAFSEGFGETVNEEMAKLNVEKGKKALEEQIQLKAGVEFAADLGDLKKALDLKTALANATNEADRKSINQQIEESLPPALRNLSAADLATEIATKFPAAIKDVQTNVNQATGEITRTYEIAGDKVDEFVEKQKEAAGEGLESRQADVIKGIQGQSQAYDAAVKSLDELSKKRAGIAATGGDTTSIDTEIKDSEAKIKELGSTLQNTLQQARSNGLFDNLAPEAQAAFDGIKARYGSTLDEMDRQAAEAKLGDTLTSAVQIKADIDAQGRLDKLVEKFQTTKDEVEKKNLAAAIASQVPAAVTAYDELGNVTGLNIEKVKELGDANKKGFADATTKLLPDYKAGLEAQVTAYQSNIDKVKDLQQKIIDANNSGRDATAYREELNKVQSAANEGAIAIGKTVSEGKKFGLIKGDVHDAGNELGLAEDHAEALNVALQQVKVQTDETRKSAEELAAAYNDAGKEFQATINTNRAAIAQLKEENTKLQKELNAVGTTDVRKDEIRKRQAEIKTQIDELFKEAKEAVAENKRREATELRIDISLGIKNISTEDLKKEADRIAADTKALRDSLAAQATGDELTVKLGEITANLTKKQGEIAEKIKDIRVKAAEAGRDPLKDIIGVGALINALTDQSKALEEQAEAERGKARDAARKKLVEELKKGIQEELKARSELFKNRIDQLKLEEAAIKGESEDAASERLAKQLERIGFEQAQEVAAVIDGNEKIIEARAALQLAEQELSKATTAEEAAEASLRVDIAKSTLADTRENLLKNNAQILGILQKFNVEREKVNREGDAAIERGRQLDKIADLKSVAAQERALSLLELKKKTKDQLDAARENEVARTEILRKAAEDRYKIEQDYFQKSSFLYRLFNDLRINLEKAFTSAVNGESRKQTETRLSEIDKQLEEVQQKLFSGLVDLENYQSEVIKLEKERAEQQKELEKGKFDFVEALRVATIESARELSKQLVGDASSQSQSVVELKLSEKETLKVLQQQYLEETGDAKRAEELAQKEFDKRVNEERVHSFIDTASAITSTLVQMTAEGRKNIGQYTAAILDVAWKSLQAQVPGWVLGIWGSSVSQLGPVAGPLAAAGITASLYALVEVAKNALTKGNGFAEGVVRLQGAGTHLSDSIPSWLSHEESVVTAQGTLAKGRFVTHEPLLKFINAGKLAEEYLASQLKHGDRFIEFADTFKLNRMTGSELKAMVFGQHVAEVMHTAPVPRTASPTMQYHIKLLRPSYQDRGATRREEGNGEVVEELQRLNKQVGELYVTQESADERLSKIERGINGKNGLNSKMDKVNKRSTSAGSTDYWRDAGR